MTHKYVWSFVLNRALCTSYQLEKNKVLKPVTCLSRGLNISILESPRKTPHSKALDRAILYYLDKRQQDQL